MVDKPADATVIATENAENPVPPTELGSGAGGSAEDLVPMEAAAITPPPVIEAPAEPHVVQPDKKRGGLVMERRLIERARVAVSSGRGDVALGVLRKHRREFASGRLAEERDALWIRALVQSGRDAAALKRGARFRNRYPKSIHRAAVESALKRLKPQQPVEDEADF